MLTGCGFSNGIIPQSGRWLPFISFAVTISLVTGCQDSQAPPMAAGSMVSNQTGLPWSGQVYSLLADDLDQDGKQDILAVDHAGGVLQTFEQRQPRQFLAGINFAGVGFHPGSLLRWPDKQHHYVLGAEGDGAIRSLQYMGNEAEFRVLSNSPEKAPRYVRHFNWPGWGDSVAVSPYANGYVVLLKGYDPQTGQSRQRVVVPLAESSNTIRGAEKITVADLNGDGVDELLLGISVTNELLVIRYPGSADLNPKTDVLLEDRTWGTPNEAQAVDLDGDGDNDLVLPDEAAPGKIHIYINDGRGGFVAGTPLDFPEAQGVTELRIQRDHDGRFIMLAAGYGAIALYRFPQKWLDGGEVERQYITWGSEIARDLLLEDMDGDGWLDAVLGRKAGEARIWIAFGSLWETFQELGQSKFVLK